MTEFELAENIRDGTRPSPVEFSNMWLVNLRITGTGLAYRSCINEHTWRDPELYLNDEFLNRCHGLLVIKNHPEAGTLTEAEFKEKVVGSVMLPYIKGDEVWAVVRIYVKDIVDEILTGKVSTSPAVMFGKDSGNIALERGETKLLIEGKPFLLDHIALVTEERGSLGVWDKGDTPQGIDISNTGQVEMNEDELKKFILDAVGGVSASLTARFDELGARMDSMEAGQKAQSEAEEKARADAAEAEEKAQKEAEEKKRADAEEEASKAREEEKNRADEAEAEKARADAQNEEETLRQDEAHLTEAQIKADSAYTACGKKAPSPFSGENALAYRKRVLAGLQTLSTKHKDLDIRAIADGAVLTMVEKEIFADAKASIEKEIASKPGQLMQCIRHDDAGRPIKEFKGDMDTWLNTVKYPSQQLVQFNTLGSNQ